MEYIYTFIGVLFLVVLLWIYVVWDYYRILKKFDKTLKTLFMVKFSESLEKYFNQKELKNEK